VSCSVRLSLKEKIPKHITVIHVLCTKKNVRKFTVNVFTYELICIQNESIDLVNVLLF